MNIPRRGNYPNNSVQCNDCGGLGCLACGFRGWLTPQDHLGGRRCERVGCDNPILPAQVVIYCTDECARLDAQP